MYYVFNKNVYLVRGAEKSCIYDFNTSKLYSVNKALSEKLDVINQQGILVTEAGADGELTKTLETLLNLGILARSLSPKANNIEDLRVENTTCDFAWIEITTNCNLRCIHCYNESDSHCHTEMTYENYKKAVDALLDMKVKRVQIIGGEPFVVSRHLLREMLDYTVGKFETIEIFTNGTLINDDWVNYFSKNGIRVALSVYSYNCENHDKITGVEGSWDRTVETVKALKDHGIQYRICNVLMKGVELGHKSTDLFELSNEKDIVRMSGRGNFSLLTDELLRAKLITAKSFKNPISKRFCSNLISGHNCFRNRIYIAADMTVYPCVMERRLKHGRIGAHGKIVLDEALRKLNKDSICECNKCEYRYACFDCRPNSLSGDTLEKPWYCTYQPLTGEWSEESSFIEELKQKWS